MSDDRAVDALRAALSALCDREPPGRRLALARTHFDQALFWLRTHHEELAGRDPQAVRPNGGASPGERGNASSATSTT